MSDTEAAAQELLRKAHAVEKGADYAERLIALRSLVCPECKHEVTDHQQDRDADPPECRQCVCTKDWAEIVLFHTDYYFEEKVNADQ